MMKIIFKLKGLPAIFSSLQVFNPQAFSRHQFLVFTYHKGNFRKYQKECQKIPTNICSNERLQTTAGDFTE